MDKEKTVNFTGSVIIFFVLLFLYSRFGPSLPISVLTQTKGEPLTVSAEGKVSVTPDIAKVTLGINDSGTSLKQVEERVNTKSKSLTDSLKKMGIDSKDIKTTNYTIYPEYDYESPVQRITGYRVMTNYQVRVRDFEKVNEVIATATQVGANMVGGVSFEVNDETRKQKLQEARELATKEAKEKAEGLAKAANINLGKVINISESQQGKFLRDINYALPVSGGGEDSQTSDIQPGETEITVNITLSYEVK